jgi:hypothetical protein
MQTDTTTPRALIHALEGDWEGTTRTWFEPDVLGDESLWRGSIRPALGGLFAIHEYTGTLVGEPLVGMAIIGYNAGRRRFEIASATERIAVRGQLHRSDRRTRLGLAHGAGAGLPRPPRHHRL